MKRNLALTQFITALLLACSILSCVEEIDIDAEFKFEDVIVIEATLTDEIKTQQFQLSRSYEFETEGPIPEQNAEVRVVVNDGESILFIEDSPGVYQSENEFAAESGAEYQLFVTTNEGRTYQSPKVPLTNSVPIENLTAERQVNSIGNEIMAILVDSYDPTRQANYYRYEYEESYKIIAPDWTRQDFVVYRQDSISPDAIRPLEEQTCYNTVNSNNIIITSTTNLSEDRVSGFSVRNISSDDPVISHRYSILVKQYVQSLEAYTYYEILNQLSGSDNTLAQIQPGFISSNIRSTQDRNEKVLGFFQVSAVTEKRLYFNYEDFFPGEPLPPYFIECGRGAPPIVSQAIPPTYPLFDAIEANLVKFLEENMNPGQLQGPYITVPRGCGDCTALGTSEPPEFWEE
ncbi:MAG: DUF4249 domain-containing protein [Lutimonas sp.]